MLQDVRPPTDLSAAALEWRAGDLLQALPVAVYTTDPSGVITAYNDAAADLWGVRPQLGSARWCGSWRLYWPDGTAMDHSECPMAVALREDRAIKGAEAVAERPNGTRVLFLAFPTPLHGADGAVIGAVNTLVDVTEQKRHALAERRLAAIVASSHDAIVSKDLNGIITSWNDSAQRLFGYSAEEVIGKSITILIPQVRQDEEPEILSRIRRGEAVNHFETIRMRKDGTQFPVSLTISPIRADDGTIIGVSKIARDITDQRDSEQRIRALMREVNHRVKNQFAVILSMIRETSKRAKGPEEFQRQVQERVLALSRSHDLLVQADWRGATMFELLLAQVKPFGNEDRVTMSGPLLVLQPGAVQYLGMAFHELATNSAKYGALSGRGGTIAVRWSVSADAGERRLRLAWSESGGPAVVPIAKGGFGTVVLQRVAPAALDGTASLDYQQDGISWSLEAPLKYVEVKCGDADVPDRATAIEVALS